MAEHKSVFYKGYWWLEFDGTVDDITINTHKDSRNKIKVGCPHCKAGTLPSSLSCMMCNDKKYIEIDG